MVYLTQIKVVNVHLVRGYCLFIQGKYEEAYKCCSSAIETDKECGLAH